MKRLPYADAEKKCAVSFLGHGDWWHLYTPGNLTELLFRDDDDYRYVMNLMARDVWRKCRDWLSWPLRL